METRILHLEAMNQILIYALQEANRQVMDSILRRRTVERLLARRSYEWEKAYEDVVELRRQMKLMENANDEMRGYKTYIEGTIKKWWIQSKKTRLSC